MDLLDESQVKEKLKEMIGSIADNPWRGDATAMVLRFARRYTHLAVFGHASSMFSTLLGFQQQGQN